MKITSAQLKEYNGRSFYQSGGLLTKEEYGFLNKVKNRTHNGYFGLHVTQRDIKKHNEWYPLG